MRKVTILVALFVLALSMSVLAEDTKKPDDMKAMQGMPPMGPTAEMKKLTPDMIGDWDCVMKFRMQPNDTNWMVSNGTCKWETILDGCVLQQTYSSNMMGMPYKGMGWLSYNTEDQTWRQTWTDNLGGTITYYTGKMVGEKMVMEGEEMMGGKPYKMRTTTVTTKPGTALFTMDMSEDGGKTYYQSMEITYTKK